MPCQLFLGFIDCEQGSGPKGAISCRMQGIFVRPYVCTPWPRLRPRPSLKPRHRPRFRLRPWPWLKLRLRSWLRLRLRPRHRPWSRL